MREIKFRAWDKEIKVLYNVISIDFERDKMILESTTKSYIHRDLDDVILMQFTGLKDKNGKEIFEGDIVIENNISSGKHTREVVFSDGCFWTKGKDNRGNLLYVPLRVEVIGNIYENPKLLKEVFEDAE